MEILFDTILMRYNTLKRRLFLKSSSLVIVYASILALNDIERFRFPLTVLSPDLRPLAYIQLQEQD